MLFEFQLKRSQRYGGAISFKDLITIALDTPAISRSIVFQPKPSKCYLLAV